jgi:hypothetical protein
MPYFFLIALLIFALPGWAQTDPKKLEPLPEAPAASIDVQAESLEPQVTILRRGQDRIEEYRLRGRLYMVKVIPAIGTPYYLVDQTGTGHLVRQDSVNGSLAVPMWVVKSF